MNTRALGIFFLLGCGAVALAACGGASAAGPAAGDAAQGDTPPTPPTPPPPPPSTLDRDLQARLAQVGIAPLQAPPDQPTALVELGRALFFDKELSGNRNIACATCHHPTTGTGDALSLPIGEGGLGLGTARQVAAGGLIPRNAPPLFNRGLPSVRRMFWDSRVSRGAGPGGALTTPEPALNGASPQARDIAAELTTALAAQAIFPLTAEAEMRGSAGENELAAAPDNLTLWARLMARLVGTENGTLGGIAAYRSLFQAAFPAVVDFDAFHIGHLGRAVAAFEDQAFRALTSPFDAYVAGDVTALADDAKRGALLFYGRADCSRCHQGPLQTDDDHHAIAIPQLGPGREADGDDLGRFEQTGDPDDLYGFRTPSLRNVELTGPWMHDGAYTSLQAAVRHYDNPVRSLQQYDATQLAPLLRAFVDRDPVRNQARADALSNILRPSPRLDAGDVADLTAFLRSLSDPASRSLAALVPGSVPSGLPVGD